MNVLLLRFKCYISGISAKIVLRAGVMQTCEATCSSAYVYNGCLAWLVSLVTYYFFSSTSLGVV